MTQLTPPDYTQGSRKWDPQDPSGPDKSYLVGENEMKTHVFDES